MLRSRTVTLITMAVVTLTAAVTLVPPSSAASPTLPQLRDQRASARRVLTEARQRALDASSDLASAQLLAGRQGAVDAAAPVAVPPGMDAALVTRLLADGVVSADELAALQARAAVTRHQVARWTLKVRRLSRRVRLREEVERWARRHQWRPLVRIAGLKYGVDPGGLYRMMMLESGGDERVVGGIYNGLFQYTHSEWARHWNPWRHESIYDGWAQIRATALALSKGMGPGQWPYTYPMAF